MKKHFLVFCFLFISSELISQSNLLNANKPSDIGKKTEKQISLDFNEPLEHPYVDDKDVLWSKIVYEYVDGYEQFNYPLFYPLDDRVYLFSSDRKSLWRIIREYIFENTLSQNGTGSRFVENLATNENIEVSDTLLIYNEGFRNFTRLDDGDRLRQAREDLPDDQKNELVIVDEIEKEDINGDGQIDWRDVGYMPSYHIVGYNLKGLWYFDKKYGELRYRLLAIQPVGYQSFEFADAPEGSPEKKPVSFFWIWYKDIRSELHKHYVFSDKNNSKRITFDQLLLSRKFHTYLYRIDNVMDDRDLINTPYIKENPYLRITESQRLKNVIRNFEHDMWSN